MKASFKQIKYLQKNMKKKSLLVLFEENELNISRLYSLYAKKIPEKYEFWHQLSNEEISHAAAIGKEKNIIDAITENNFSRGVIKYVMDFVLEEIKKSRKEKITHQKAIQTALRVERSMLEKKCFEIFIPVNEKVKNILCKLNKETEQHVKVLTEEMKKNKFIF